ncbi:hypothetical protein NHH03_13000 [Stieleria sp. TO1_6]|uniref:hypothetical protein n=1 Tax=Stieleria tagensis TaxID=2956795 RepID=UPI00209A76F0|nr:hypothetical protein [Stieleria tagensis]MCO8122658.1 hypothetical protein [Stieleria tagensis]
MALRFSIRALMAVIAALAVLFGAMLYPSPLVGDITLNVVFVAILVAACLAVGARQPARSFWLAFAIAASGFLMLDTLSRFRWITSDVFTRKLTEFIDDTLPPVEFQGEPDSRYFFRSDSRHPIYYYEFDQSGKRVSSGQMTITEARAKGAFSRGQSIDDLPHIENQPTDYVRRKMLPFVLAGTVGMIGGLLAYFTRLRSLTDSTSPPRHQATGKG